MPGTNFSRFLLWGLVLTMPAYAAWPDLSQRQSLHIIQTEDPIHPPGLLTQGVVAGYATFLLDVSAEGQLVDCLVTAYSRKEFADAVLAAMKKWRFEPAKIDGEPVGVITELRVDFESGTVVVVLTPSETVDMARFRLANFRSYAISKLKELDRIPVPIAVTPPVYPEELMHAGVVGRAVVEFIIDETGRVRMSSVVSADHRELAQLAGEAVKSWRFEPPLVKGRPVAVRAQQRFDFTAKKPVAAAGS